jgi:hypothetical protein
MSKSRALPGYRRIPGKARRYLDLNTGEEISRLQYQKRTKGESFYKQAKRKKKERKETGEQQPMTRYNAIVRQYKMTHPNVKVRGDSPEAREFKKLYKSFTKPTRTKKERIRHLKMAEKLGIITNAQFERYSANE